MFCTGVPHIFVGIGFQLVPVLLAQEREALILSRPETPTYVPGVGDISGVLDNSIGTDPPQELVQALALFNRQPVYLGTAEKSPRIERLPSFVPWYDDETGSSLPADELYEGEECLVIADLTRWREVVVAFMQCAVNAAPLGGRRGIDVEGAVGTSMTMEGHTYPLIVQWPYNAKPSMGLRGMPPGYRFFHAKLIAPDVCDDMGHQPLRRRLVWQARKFHDLASGVGGLYDHLALNLPAVA